MRTERHSTPRLLRWNEVSCQSTGLSSARSAALARASVGRDITVNTYGKPRHLGADHLEAEGHGFSTVCIRGANPEAKPSRQRASQADKQALNVSPHPPCTPQPDLAAGFVGNSRGPPTDGYQGDAYLA